MFVAVTTTLTVEPTSPATKVYVCEVAPPIGTQFAPPASHRCHAYPNDGAGTPTTTPSTPSTPDPQPQTQTPPATPYSPAPTDLHNPVCAEVAFADPAVFVAVTTTLIVEPTSPATNEYVCEVAPAIGTQFAPPASHRCHAYPNDGAGTPDHVPVEAVNT